LKTFEKGSGYGTASDDVARIKWWVCHSCGTAVVV